MVLILYIFYFSSNSYTPKTHLTSQLSNKVLKIETGGGLVSDKHYIFWVHSELTVLQYSSLRYF